MRVKFLQAAHFAGKDYGKGTHDVPEVVTSHKFFHKMVEAGLIVDVEASEMIAPKSLQERAKDLAEKLAKPVVRLKPGVAPEKQASDSLSEKESEPEMAALDSQDEFEASSESDAPSEPEQKEPQSHKKSNKRKR
jgi:hypothetical protein